jgi:MinD-like ATPase involved in chromosome partitioning or flagellar assembly
MTFDLVLPTLLRICENHPGFHQVERACVVRDVQGRVRLILKTKGELDIGSLSDELSAELQGFFAMPLLTVEQGGEHRRLAEALLQRAPNAPEKSWPLGWPTEVVEPITGAKRPLPDRWSGIERTVAKESWLAQQLPSLPWPAHPRAPRIVTFYSFKGGVGRTTLVAAYALHLAKRGTKVAIVDLDLEAPGIGTLLDVRTQRGVIDLLADHIATDTMDLDDSYGYADALGDLADKIAVFPAGQLGPSFVSKLARLDFASTEIGGTNKNAVASALEELLRQLRRQGYGAILLDARAGLHDLAGLSLHGLAHLDVLVFRGTTQNLDGLSLTLDVLHRRRRDDDQRPWILVHTLLPIGQEEFERKRSDAQQRVYDIFLERIYEGDGDDVPQLNDRGAAHETMPLRRKPWLEDIDTLRGLADTLLTDEELSAILRRIDEHWDKEPDQNEDAS